MAGPPPQEQIDATLQWVTDCFGRWYEAHPPDLPPRFTRREFGFIWTAQKFFLRHTSFGSQSAFHEFLAQRAPHHAYYSTAYYKTPHAATMKEKEWLGADLIFDLDADHLPDADKLTFAQQLDAVKTQARKLLDEFLLGDFGFDEKDVRIVFSGGRGYHFHVSDPRVLMLSSAERREIVDYISPNPTVLPTLFEKWVQERAFTKDDFGRSKKTKIIPTADAPGWDGRLTRAFVQELERLRTMEPEAAVRHLKRLEGIGKKTAEDVVEWLTPERIARIREDGRLDQFQAVAKSGFLQGLQQDVLGLAKGETDEPVTADVKRLIRLPGSLHGKTGLRVTPLTRAEFERFDPLRDAAVLGDEPVEVVVSKPQEVVLGGKSLAVEAGPQTLPLQVAMFLVLRRAALRPWPHENHRER